MLITNPKEFAHVAQEWAVKYAGAPAQTGGESSGGVSDEALKKQEESRKQKEEAEKLAEYVKAYHLCSRNGH